MTQTDRNKCKLATMFTLNFSFFVVELVVGIICKSTALVADSFHMLSDVVALIVAFIAVKLSQKKWSKNTYGFVRAEVLGALVNAVFLTALCFSILIDVMKRFVDSKDEIEQPLLLMIVGAIGLLMNLVGLCIFNEHGHSHGGGHDHGHHGHSHGHDGGSSYDQSGERRLALTHSNRLTRIMQTTSGEEIPSQKDSNNTSETPTTVIPAETAASESERLDSRNVDDDLSSDTEPLDKIKTKKKKKKKKNASQMNIRGVFLHLLADTLGSVVVVVSAGMYLLCDAYGKADANNKGKNTCSNKFCEFCLHKKYIDPVLSLVMICLIFSSVLPLLIESSLILLQSVPDHIKIDELERTIRSQIKGVIGVHEFHVWQLAGDKNIATVHIKCGTLEEYFEIAAKVMLIFHDAGIHSATIQPEFSQQSPKGDINAECFLSCSAFPNEIDCSASTCCPKPSSPKKNAP